MNIQVNWTAVVGLAGIAGTVTAGWLQGRSAVKAAVKQGDVTRDVADRQIAANLVALREERHQTRLERGYVSLLKYLDAQYAWVLRVYPIWTASRDDYTMPALPNPPEMDQDTALLLPLLSPRLHQLMAQWRDAMSAVTFNGSAVQENHRAAGNRTRVVFDRPESCLLFAKERVSSLVDAITAQVGRELTMASAGEAVEDEVVEPMPVAPVIENPPPATVAEWTADE